MSAPTTQDTSTGTANSKKRKREDNDENDTSVKKQIKLSKLEQQEKDIRDTALELKRDLGNLQKLIDMYSLSENGMIWVLVNHCDNICGGAERHTAAFNVLNCPFKPFDDVKAFSAIPDHMRMACISFIDTAAITLKKVANIYGDLLKMDASAPSASNYINPTVWPEWQRKPTGILNLRPSDNQSLPISTLHPVFGRFRAALKQPLPRTGDTSIAHRVAFHLCTEMANSFKDEKDRRNEFERCIRPLFVGYIFQHEALVESDREAHSSTADLLVFLHGRPVLMGVNKLESGDAYIQVSRVYQTWVNHRIDENAIELPHGAPMILISLIGPLFIVAGGFFDGNHVIVEPLAEPCLMLPDYHHNRQEHLMRILLATKEATESLARLNYDALVSVEPAVPRVYPKFTTFDNQDHTLTFMSRLLVRTDGPDRDLLFLATTPASSNQVLVKLVAGDQYGVEAHRRLAEAGYAPTLLGIARAEGAHTAYIMEHLSPNEGWTTLHVYAKDHQDVISHIEAPLALLMRVMEEENIAHGDLRPNNIMVRHAKGAKEPEFKVLDFDWAGASGTVKYPWRRNESIPWPARSGEPILTEHDRTLLMSYFTPKP